MREAKSGRRTRRNTSPKAIREQQQRRRALELRLAGHTHQEIADRLGWKNVSSAWRAIRHAMREVIEEPAEELRKLYLARLERLYCENFPYAVARKVKVKEQVRVGRRWVEQEREVELPPDVKHTEICLKVLKQEAELLGLNAPKRTHIGGDKDAPPVQFDVNDCVTEDDLDKLPLEVRLAMLEFLRAKKEKAALPPPVPAAEGDNKGGGT
jgi:hypothetical protein